MVLIVDELFYYKLLESIFDIDGDRLLWNNNIKWKMVQGHFSGNSSGA